MNHNSPIYDTILKIYQLVMEASKSKGTLKFLDFDKQQSIQSRGLLIKSIRAVSFVEQFDPYANDLDGDEITWNNYVESMKSTIHVDTYFTTVRDKACQTVGLLAFYDAMGQEQKMKHMRLRDWVQLQNMIIAETKDQNEISVDKNKFEVLIKKHTDRLIIMKENMSRWQEEKWTDAQVDAAEQEIILVAEFIRDLKLLQSAEYKVTKE